MERDEAQLDVCIVQRDEANDVEAEYWIQVVKAYEENGTRYLQYREQSECADMVVSINIEKYFILALRAGVEEGSPGIEEPYSSRQEDQNEAFEAIEKILADEEGFRVAESQASTLAMKSTSVVGPRRVEIVVRSVSLPTRTERIVVTSVSPPTARFSTLAVMGRGWLEDPSSKKPYLSAISALTTTYSNILVQIHEFAGGPYGASSIHHIGPSKEDQERGWALLEKAQERLTQSEVAVIRRWTFSKPDETDEEEYGAYWQRVPAAYQAPKAYFRVSGDDIGATLYREQQAKIQEELAKPEATATSEASSSDAQENATTVDAPFCDCRSPMCDICLWHDALHHMGGQRPPGVTFH